jgi:hypothetical protein
VYRRNIGRICRRYFEVSFKTVVGKGLKVCSLVMDQLSSRVLFLHLKRPDHGFSTSRRSIKAKFEFFLKVYHLAHTPRKPRSEHHQNDT